MDVWEVGVSDCESSATCCICSTKELAERELFKIRDSLVSDWQEQIDRHESLDIKGISHNKQKKMVIDMYEPMINALTSNDYESWNNYPHERPWIRKTTVVDK